MLICISDTIFETDNLEFIRIVPGKEPGTKAIAFRTKTMAPQIGDEPAECMTIPDNTGAEALEFVCQYGQNFGILSVNNVYDRREEVLALEQAQRDKAVARLAHEQQEAQILRENNQRIAEEWAARQALAQPESEVVADPEPAAAPPKTGGSLIGGKK